MTISPILPSSLPLSLSISLSLSLSFSFSSSLHWPRFGFPRWFSGSSLRMYRSSFLFQVFDLIVIKCGHRHLAISRRGDVLQFWWRHYFKKEKKAICARYWARLIDFRLPSPPDCLSEAFRFVSSAMIDESNESSSLFFSPQQWFLIARHRNDGDCFRHYCHRHRGRRRSLATPRSDRCGAI